MNLPFAWSLALAGILGFIALAYEILWMRFHSFATGSRGEAFGALLGSYLLGLALGSLLSRRWQRDAAENTGQRLRTFSRMVLVANLAGFLVVPLASWCIVKLPASLAHRGLPLVVVGAALMGTLLPLLCHDAIAPNDRVGSQMSWVYLANIVGSGIGSLITGFLLMDRFGLGQIATGLLVLGLAVAVCLAGISRSIRVLDGFLWGCAVLLACASPVLHDGLFERLFYKSSYTSATRFAQIVESRHGVITVDTHRTIYGGGVYDGVIDTRLEVGSGLIRPYFVSALHPRPSEVLVIGVSGGAWTQILAHNPNVQSVTAVEINQGYLKIIRNHPEVASLLTNPKVDLVIDDGRRWLRRNPDRRFDMIVMNTTFHWREFASALLSREFLELVRDHLKPGGLTMWNCTSSPRAIRTGLEVFPYTLMVMNNCVGSLSPIITEPDRWQAVLAEYRIDGKPVFDLSTPGGQRQFEDVLSFAGNNPARGWTHRSIDRKKMQERYGLARIITDDNLGDEYPGDFELLNLLPGFVTQIFGSSRE